MLNGCFCCCCCLINDYFIFKMSRENYRYEGVYMSEWNEVRTIPLTETVTSWRQAEDHFSRHWQLIIPNARRIERYPEGNIVDFSIYGDFDDGDYINVDVKFTARPFAHGCFTSADQYNQVFHPTYDDRGRRGKGYFVKYNFTRNVIELLRPY